MLVTNKQKKTIMRKIHVKKTMMTIASSFVALCVNAQAYLGGSLCYRHIDVPGKSGVQSANAFKISPEFGYAINGTWSVGLGLGYMTTDYVTTTEGNLGGFLEATSNSRLTESFEMYTLAPYIRGNFYKSKVVNLFADGIFEYGHIDGVGAKSNVYGFGIRPGVLITLNERFSFVTRLGGISYASTDTDYEKGSSRITAFEFNLTSLDNLEFGLYYNF